MGRDQERDTVRDTVLGALARVAPEIDRTTIDPAADLRDACDLDSVDFLTFVERLHETTGVEIPERDYPRLASVDLAVAYLEAAATGDAPSSSSAP